MHGYHGNFLRINAASGVAERCPLTESVCRRFIGGSGLGTWLLLREGAAERPAEDPLSPVAFVFSPLVGSPLTTSAKFAVVSKSPLTGRLNDSLASSGLALSGKGTGSDALVIRGAAREASVLLIDEGRVSIEPAGSLRHMPVGEAEQELTARYGRGFRFAVIGPAGERRVRFATLSHDGRHAGRGGTGAVLGAKNLKAIGVRGSQGCSWAQPNELLEAARQLSKQSLGPATAKYRELGTAANLTVFNRLHALPNRNFQAGSSDEVFALAPESLAAVREHTRASCVACTIGCEHLYALDGSNGRSRQVRLEYENLFALGPLCGIYDSDIVLEASRRCDAWGLDTVSTGGTIAFAMECAERGWLEIPWLRFGGGEGLLRAIDLIAERRGVGAALAEGSRQLAARLGPAAEALAPQVKGLEIPGYEPRALQTMALGLAVGTRGADHNRSSAYEVDFSAAADRRGLVPESAPLAVAAEDRAALMDSLILCKFLRGVFEDFLAESARMLGLVTGWDLTSHELQRAARRIVTAKKLFNIRAGWTPAEDTLPARFLHDPLPDDPEARLTPATLQAAIRSYNRCRGWTDDGYLPPPLLADLQLTDV